MLVTNIFWHICLLCLIDIVDIYVIALCLVSQQTNERPYANLCVCIRERVHCTHTQVKYTVRLRLCHKCNQFHKIFGWVCLPKGYEVRNELSLTNSVQNCGVCLTSTVSQYATVIEAWHHIIYSNSLAAVIQAISVLHLKRY